MTAFGQASKGVNFQRYAVLSDEYLFIAEGFCMVARGPVFRVDGYCRVEGVICV